MGKSIKMKTFNSIINILKKEGYEITQDTKARIEHMLECLEDKNRFNNLDQIMEWFKNQRRKCEMEVKKIGINELEKWDFDNKTQNIVHDSGEFFSVIGVKVLNSKKREVGEWTQPMIWQKEGGILGILSKKFNGVRHYLIHAKAEPGNIHKLQLSPTLQATFSNLKKAHKGNKPKFAEYFENPEKENVIYSKSFAEDGGRFYLKTNYNMLVEVDENEEIEVPDDYIWLTMYQIKQLLKYDNLINPHVRSIISYL
ncbi:response regulator receiver protein [Candidatus Woesearchaeota archaeon]|nr:response regulator receiver protein [Candidatus Woesearchaeota archaeon]|tara:strand:- start:1037 stop:1801 length:765 start_codon:yes stop_codon:yes gene_type:complete